MPSLHDLSISGFSILTLTDPRGETNEGNDVFVWVFHRISGILLIFLLLLQLLSGFFQAAAASSNSEWIWKIADLHNQQALNCLLLLLVIFHGMYGIRMSLMDVGRRRGRLLFWVCTAVGVVLYVAFLIAFFMLVAK